MRITAPFHNNPVKANLIQLNNGSLTGNWRDSSEGLANGTIPYDVNTALVPASLRAIASLIRKGFFENIDGWKGKALRYVYLHRRVERELSQFRKLRRHLAIRYPQILSQKNPRGRGQIHGIKICENPHGALS